jgi:MoaA/NifB/PqqE/SkfB family radical SAM enzyme
MVPEVHDRLRGMPGAWQRAMEALEHFQELRGKYPHFEVEVFSVLMEPTLPHLPQVARFCRERRIVWDYQEIMGTFAFGSRPFTPEWRAANPLFVRDLAGLERSGGPGGSGGGPGPAGPHPGLFPGAAAAAALRRGLDYQGELKFCFALGSFGTWRDPLLATWRQSPRARLERRRTRRCPLPCSLLMCNLYRSTLTKVREKISHSF